MTQAPLSLFQQYQDPLKPLAFNPQDYSADPQASSGDNPYDQWLYSQNKRLSNFNLPAYQSRHPVPQQPQVQAQPGTETYTNQQAPVAWKQPSGYPGPAAGSPNYPGQSTPEPSGGFGGVQTVVGPYSGAPKTAEQIAYENQRKFIQDTIANSQADPAKGIQQLAAAGIDYNTANDALNYTGYDLGGQQVDATAYLRAHGGGLEGLTTYNPEQVTSFINWQNSQTNPLTGGVLSYDTSDPTYRARVQETMDRDARLANMRGQEAPAWLSAQGTAQPLAAGGLARPFARGGLADMAHSYNIHRSI